MRGRIAAWILVAGCACRGGSERSPAVGGAAVRAPGRPALEVHGHRGCRGLRPENTLAAFRHAIHLGVDVLELDLGLTRDGVLVVIHDPAPRADLCDGVAGLPSPWVKDLTFAELGRLDCGTRRDPRFPEQQAVPGERIPRLEQVLELVAARPGLRANVEIKTFREHPEHTRPPIDFARALVESVRRAGLVSRVIVQSFDPRALVEVARLEPRLTLAALVERMEQAEEMLGQTGARVLSPRHTALRESHVRALQGRGLRVIPWTVNEPARMKELSGWGVDGIITDRPDLLLALLRR